MKGFGSHCNKMCFFLELSHEMANSFNSGRILLNKMEVGSENVFVRLTTSVQHVKR